MIYTGPQLDYSEMRRRGAEMARTLEEKKQREESGIWWSGDQPTAAETEAQIWKVYGDDEVAKNGAYAELDKEYDNPDSIFYNPFRKATNQAWIDDLAKRGVDVSGGITDDFFVKYADYAKYLEKDRSKVSGTPTTPDKGASNEEMIAWDIYQLAKDNDATKKAESEWAQMQKEITYWTEKGLTDNEIKAKIDMSKYSTLQKMDDYLKPGGAFDTMPTFNRAIGYSKDAIDGVIWAARNKGFSSGDYFQDAVYSKLGYGNLGHSSYSSMAQRTPGSAAYHPYKSGATNDNDRMILGRDSFDQNFFNTTTAILQNPESEEAKAWARRYDREKPTQQAEAELAALQNKLNSITEITPKEGESVYEAALRLVDRYLEEGVAANDFTRMSMLQKMDEERAKGQALDLNRTVDYRREDMAANLAARITREQRKAQQKEEQRQEAAQAENRQPRNVNNEMSATPEERAAHYGIDEMAAEGEEQRQETAQTETEPAETPASGVVDPEEYRELLDWVNNIHPNVSGRTGLIASAGGPSGPMQQEQTRGGRATGRFSDELFVKSQEELQGIIDSEDSTNLDKMKARIALGYATGEITDETLNTYLALNYGSNSGNFTYEDAYNALTASVRGDKLDDKQLAVFNEIYPYAHFVMKAFYDNNANDGTDALDYYGQDVVNLISAMNMAAADVEDVVEATLEIYGAAKSAQYGVDRIDALGVESLDDMPQMHRVNLGLYYEQHPEEAEDLKAITDRVTEKAEQRRAAEAEREEREKKTERLINQIVLDMVEEAIATGDTSNLTPEAIQQFNSIVGSDQYGTVKDLQNDAWAQANIYNTENGLRSDSIYEGYESAIEKRAGGEIYNDDVAVEIVQLMEDHYLLHYREARALGQTLEEFYAENPSKYVSPADLRESAENQYKKKFDSDVPEVAQDIKDGVGWLEAVRRGAVSGGYIFASGFVGFAADVLDVSEEQVRNNNLDDYTRLYGGNARWGYTQELTAYANSLPEDDLRRAQILGAIEESRTTGRDIMYYSFNLNREKLEDVRSGLMANVEANAQYMQEHGTKGEQDWYRWISSAVNSTLGTFASAALASIPGVSPLAATAIVFAPGVFDQTYRQYKDSLGRERAMLIGFASGAWEAISEQWMLTKYLPGGDGLGATMRKGFTDIISREGAKGFNKVMTAIGGFGMLLAGNTIEEQGQELMQDAGEAMLQYYIARDADAFVNFANAENIKDILVSTALSVFGNTTGTMAFHGAAKLTAKTLNRLNNNAIDTSIAENAALYDAVKAGQDSTQAISEGMASGEVQAAPMTEEQAQAIVDEAMAGQTSLFDFVEDEEAAPAEAPEGELPGQTSMFDGMEEEAPQEETAQPESEPVPEDIQRILDKQARIEEAKRNYQPSEPLTFNENGTPVLKPGDSMDLGTGRVTRANGDVVDGKTGRVIRRGDQKSLTKSEQKKLSTWEREREAKQAKPAPVVDGVGTATDSDAFADMAEMAVAEEEQAEPAPAPKEEAPTFPARRNRHPATQGGNMSLAESRARAARAARVAQQGIDTFTDGTKTPAERLQGLQTAAAGLEAGNNANAESGLAGPISGTYVAMANAYTEALQAGDTETANSIVAQMQADTARHEAAQQAEQAVEQTTTAQAKKDDAARQVAQTIVQNPEVQHKMAQDIADQQTASTIAAWPDGIPNTQEAKTAKQALDDIDAELEVARAKAESAAQKREAARQNAAQALQDAKNAPQDKRLVKRASSMKGVMTKAENLYLAAQDELQRLDQQRAVAEKKLNDIKDAEAERARSASAISAEAQVATTVAQASEALAAEAQAQADVAQEIAEQDAAEAAENAENEAAEGMADEDRQNAETLVEAPEEAPKAQPIVQNPEVQHQAVEVTDEQTAPAETAPTEEAPAAEPVQEEATAPTDEKATPELVKQEHKLLMLRNRLEAVLSMRADENSATFALHTKGDNIEGQQTTITGQNHAAQQIALEINELLEEMGYPPFNLTYADGVRLMSSNLSSYHFKTISENFANGDAIADRWNGKDAPQYNRQSNAQTARALSFAGTPYMIAELRNSKGMINGQAVMLLNPARMGYFRDAIVSHIRNGADIHLNVDGLTEDAQKMVTKVLNGLKNTGNLTFDGQTSIAIDQEAEQGIKNLMKKIRGANTAMPSGTDVARFLQKHSGEKFSREAIDSMIEHKGWMSSGDLKALENALRSNPELAQWLNGLEGKDLQAIVQSVAHSQLKNLDESEVLAVLRRHQDVTQRENWAQLRDNMLNGQQRANDKVLGQLVEEAPATAPETAPAEPPASVFTPVQQTDAKTDIVEETILDDGEPLIDTASEEEFGEDEAPLYTREGESAVTSSGFFGEEAPGSDPRHGKRQFSNQTAQRTATIPEAIKDELRNNPVYSDYDIDSNKHELAVAQAALNKHGVDESFDMLMEIEGLPDKYETALSVLVMQELSSADDMGRMLQLTAKYAATRTELGQSLQAGNIVYKIFGKLSPVDAVVKTVSFASKKTRAWISKHGRAATKAMRNASALANQLQSIANAAETSADNKWHIDLNGYQRELISHYKLDNVARPGLYYNRATIKQRMLEAIICTTDPLAVNHDGRNLIEQLEMIRRGAPIATNADAIYIRDQATVFHNNHGTGSYLDTREAQLALARETEAVNNIEIATTWEKIRAQRYINMLLSVPTFLRNEIGNEGTNAVLNAPARAVEIGLDKALSLFTGKRTTAGQSFDQWVDSWRKSFQEVGNTWQDYTKEHANTSPNPRKRYNITNHPRTFQNPFLQAVADIESLMMSIGDRRVWTRHFYQSLNSQINAANINGERTGAAKITAPTDAMVEQAIEDGSYSTFTEDTALINVMNTLKNQPGFVGIFFRGLAPFTGVPTNILRRTYQYSPFGLASSAVKHAYQMARNGTFDQHRFVQDISRGLTGTGLTVLGVALADMAFIKLGTGDDDDMDAKEKALRSANGEQYSFYVKNPFNGKYMSLSPFAPFINPLILGAMIWEATKNDADVMSILMSTLTSGAQQIYEASYLTGFSDTLNALSEGGVEDAAIAFAGNVISSAVPQPVAQLAGALDPYARDTNDKNKVLKMLKSGIAYRLPFIRTMLPEKVDVTGRTVPNYKQGFQYFISPFTYSIPAEDDAIDELLRIGQATGRVDFYPNDPLYGSRDTLSGVARPLTKEEKVAFKKLNGGLAFNGGMTKDANGNEIEVMGIRKFMASAAYQDMTDEERADQIKAIVASAKTGSIEWAKDTAGVKEKAEGKTSGKKIVGARPTFIDDLSVGVSLDALYDNTFDGRYYPTAIPESFSYNKEKFDLTGENHDAFQKIYAEQVDEKINSLFEDLLANSEKYEAKDGKSEEEVKAEAFKSAFEKALSDAKKIWRTSPELWKK